MGNKGVKDICLRKPLTWGREFRGMNQRRKNVEDEQARRNAEAAGLRVCPSPGGATRADDFLGGFPFDPSNPSGFSSETLAAMDDAALGRNLSGPYYSVKEVKAALDEE